MFLLIKFIVLVTVFQTFGFSTDYCNKDLCKFNTISGYAYKTHIGCNNKNNFQAACPTDANEIYIGGTEYQDLIIELTNDYRGQLARGELGFKPAARMPRVQWHEELAYLAGMHVKTCTFMHDQCRNTDDFAWSGQNLARYSGSPNFINVTKVITGAHKMWFDERKNTTQANLDKYGATKTTIGHFTAMVQDKAKYLGCALVQYTSEGKKFSQFTCNYSFTNVRGTPVYKSSGVACSKCTTGCIKGLCSDYEDINAVP